MLVRGASRTRNARSRGRAQPETGSGREDILRAAAKEFAAKGFHGATTAGIARAAGVTQPLVHHHFGSKVGLWEAVLKDLFGELRVLQEGTLRDLHGVDTAAWLRILLRQFVLFSARRPELARIMAVEGAPTKGLDPALEEQVRPQMEQLEGFVRLLVGEQRLLLSRREIQLLCFLITGASTHPFLTGGTARRVFGLDVGDTEVAQEYADLVVRVLFDALAARAGEADRTPAKNVPSGAATPPRASRTDAARSKSDRSAARPPRRRARGQ